MIRSRLHYYNCVMTPVSVVIYGYIRFAFTPMYLNANRLDIEAKNPK
jgi:hypothetical protein